MKKYTKESLIEVVSTSKTIREVLLSFNRNDSAASYKQLNKLIKEWDINIKHFLSRSEITKKMFNDGKLKKLNDGDIFVINSSTSRATVKQRLIQCELIKYECYNCGNKGEWLGEKMTLILDHINGVNNDNRLVNLRFVCPNCNSQLKTHCMGSKAFEDKPPKIDKRTLNHDRPYIRKVVWPDKDELKGLLDKMSYVSIGEKYGVSDTTIRKWSKKYNLI